MYQMWAYDPSYLPEPTKTLVRMLLRAEKLLHDTKFSTSETVEYGRKVDAWLHEFCKLADENPLDTEGVAVV